MTVSPSDQEAVKRRAYELWEADGRPEGRQDTYWELALASLAGAAEAAPAGAPEPTASPPQLPSVNAVLDGFATATGVLFGAAALTAGTAQAFFQMIKPREPPAKSD